MADKDLDGRDECLARGHCRLLFEDFTDTFCELSFVIAGLDPAIHDEVPRIPT